jgi:hypothetical protein
MAGKGSPSFVSVILAAGVVFTGAMATSAYLLTGKVQRLFDEAAMDAGHTSIQQVIATRRWNSDAGGVYVPIEKGAIPNPYLKDSMRDLTSMEGITLTKVNPAYMTRLIAETLKKGSGVQLHLTSLNPLNPGNVGDEFERDALQRFEVGEARAWTVEDRVTPEGEVAQAFRYMEALRTDQPCLACHAEQGYKLGSIRGGVAVSFDYRPYREGTNEVKRLILYAHLFAYLFGVALLAFVSVWVDTTRRS